MQVNDLVNLVSNVGFPVVISGYLLIRLEKQIIALSASINKLNTIISAKLGIAIDNSEENKSA
ncbi:YvrJ family protein [Clostridium sp. C8-1-8]|uniref:YvrJ family protein n=1 Tax=Clostridium sp. C8-1-8 TaxID=2698831 RepID=UPI001368ABEA|nr:YvrJ family protein [Clostridium sp. C8-1-8]